MDGGADIVWPGRLWVGVGMARCSGIESVAGVRGEGT